MKRLSIIKITICAILFCCLNMAYATDEQTATPEQTEQLQSIEKYISAEQQLIENRYDQQIEALLKYTEDRAKKIYASYRMLWIKYYDMIKDTPAKDDYLLTSSLYAHGFDHLSNISDHLSNISGQTITTLKSMPRPQRRPNFISANTDRVREQMISSFSLYKAPVFLLDRNARDFVAYIANNSNYGSSISLLRSQAREVLKVMDNLQSQLSRHQEYRQRALANLTEVEISLKEDTLREVSPIQQQSKGIVNATAYVKDNWLAMVDDKIVHEGDTINNIKIVKIDAKKVQFKKNSQTWTQSLGEDQEVFWQ